MKTLTISLSLNGCIPSSYAISSGGRHKKLIGLAFEVGWSRCDSISLSLCLCLSGTELMSGLSQQGKVSFLSIARCPRDFDSMFGESA